MAYVSGTLCVRHRDEWSGALLKLKSRIAYRHTHMHAELHRRQPCSHCILFSGLTGTYRLCSAYVRSLIRKDVMYERANESAFPEQILGRTIFRTTFWVGKFPGKICWSKKISKHLCGWCLTGCQSVISRVVMRLFDATCFLRSIMSFIYQVYNPKPAVCS